MATGKYDPLLDIYKAKPKTHLTFSVKHLDESKAKLLGRCPPISSDDKLTVC